MADQETLTPAAAQGTLGVSWAPGESGSRQDGPGSAAKPEQ